MLIINVYDYISVSYEKTDETRNSMKIFDYIRQKPKGLKSFSEIQESTTSASSYLIDEKAPSPLAIIYRSELDYISKCVLDYPNIETGGQLFGFWTNQGVPVVLYSIGPGHNANHQKSFFNQDSNYLNTVGNALLDRFALCHIGEWHSHHQLGLAQPSGHDAQTMFHGIQSIPQRRLILCICNYQDGRTTINPYNFHENDMRHYKDAMWQVVEMESPFRQIADNTLSDLLVHPKTSRPLHGNNRIVEKNTQQSSAGIHSIEFDSEYWLIRQGNAERMKQMLATVRSQITGKSVDIQANEKGVVQLYINDGEIIIRFPKNFPEVPPLLIFEGETCNLASTWSIPENDDQIITSFKQWLSDIDTSTFSREKNIDGDKTQHSHYSTKDLHLRIQMEKEVLEKIFPSNSFEFHDLDSNSPYLRIGLITNNGKTRVINMDLSAFPKECPKVYVEEMLHNYSGEIMDSCSYSDRTLKEKNGWTQLDLGLKTSWEQDISLYKLWCLARMWLEGYQSHLQTGKPMEKYLNGLDKSANIKDIENQTKKITL